MGGVVDIITGKSGDDAAAAATQAGNIQAQAAREGTEELRRQFDISQQNLAPFLQAGTSGLGQLQESSTLGGIDAMLAEIMGGGAFGSLVDERTRAVEGQLAAGGLTRSGAGIQAAAAVPTDLAFQLEQLLFGRNQDLVNMGQSTAVGQANLGSQTAQSIASQQNQAAQAQASGILGAQQAQTAGAQNLLNLGATLGSAALLAPTGTFSDPLLKENIREIGKVGPLTLVEWDWKEETKGTIIEHCPTMGFMSTDVQEHYPDMVDEFGGYQVVKYGELLDRLEE
jgi:hypothetical protein